jgi:hypothetical protein
MAVARGAEQRRVTRFQRIEHRALRHRRRQVEPDLSVDTVKWQKLPAGDHSAAGDVRAVYNLLEKMGMGADDLKAGSSSLANRGRCRFLWGRAWVLKVEGRTRVGCDHTSGILGTSKRDFRKVDVKQATNGCYLASRERMLRQR